MRRARRRKLLIAAVAILTPVVLAFLAIVFGPSERPHQRNWVALQKPEAPPDLAQLRPAFAAALGALNKKDPDAARQFAAFSFKHRAVEDYRLYLLAQAQQLAKDASSARVTLAMLWNRGTRMLPRDDAGERLGALYADEGDFRHAADLFADVATHTNDSGIAANARWNALTARIADGDVAGALFAARNLAVKAPRASQTVDAIGIVRTLTSIPADMPIHLTPDERLERAVAFLRDGDPQNALDEMNAFEPFAPASMHNVLELNRGLALNQLRRYEDSNKLLEPLKSQPPHIAVPAIYFSSRNDRVLSASINPIVNKVIVVKQRVGKGKKARTRKVKKTVQLVDLAKKAKKEAYDASATAKLKSLLPLPLSDDLRVDVLGSLINAAEAKNQDAYERELIPQLAKIDPSQEAGLQHFWDKAWAAYARGDLNGAMPQLEFLRDNYRNPNVKRQANYWLARCLDRLGRKEQAQALYRNLASAPYEDVYVRFSVQRGAPHQTPSLNPLKMNRPDWRDIAEHSMPPELRLAYELTALYDARDARAEILANRTRHNQQFADALQADLYNSTGNMLLMMRALRSAFPQLATVEQDSVPPYFLRMYYPLRFEDAIRKFSKKNGLDPHLMMGLIHQESYFNPRTRSAVGAIGLMQLMPATGKELGSRLFHSFNVSRLENPEVNIELGTMHFRYLVDMFGGKVELAIASYNAGQGNVLKWRRAAPGKPMDEFVESIPFAETRNYVKRVTMLAASYSRIAD